MKTGDIMWVARPKWRSTYASAEQQGDDLFVLDTLVERKNCDDLLQSIHQNRYMTQKYYMRRSGVRRLMYLVEGDPDVMGDGSVRACCPPAFLHGPAPALLLCVLAHSAAVQAEQHRALGFADLRPEVHLPHSGQLTHRCVWVGEQGRQAVKSASLATEVIDGFTVLRTRDVLATFRLYARITRALQARPRAHSCVLERAAPP